MNGPQYKRLFSAVQLRPIAERPERGWIAIESLEPYLEASKLRFEDSTPNAKTEFR
jgi:hypothetical protein